ncbi:hypothetical protein A7981_05760 [Methylovorus sp. MM2]|nr:hypothetical protein A7981_05760 [Methylovorus sp. MM2]
MFASAEVTEVRHLKKHDVVMHQGLRKTVETVMHPEDSPIVRLYFKEPQYKYFEAEASTRIVTVPKELPAPKKRYPSIMQSNV